MRVNRSRSLIEADGSSLGAPLRESTPSRILPRVVSMACGVELLIVPACCAVSVPSGFDGVVSNQRTAERTRFRNPSSVFSTEKCIRPGLEFQK